MTRIQATALLALALALAGCGDGGGDSQQPADHTPGGLPLVLPFEYARADVGTPLTETEIADFTARITGLWKQIDLFTWVYETSHGIDASTGMPDYLIWWHDVDAVKQGDTVTFMNASRHGGSHNNAKPTTVTLIQAMAGHLLSGDDASARIVEQFSKATTAMMKGFVYDDSDENVHIMARNIVTHNHSFTLPSGKKKVVDYSEWYNEYEGWNADRYHYSNNPTWGDIYVTTQRSKDDVPYLYRAAAWFPYLVELGTNEVARNAAAEAYEWMQGFARDVVEHGYRIRSKRADGTPYVIGYSGDPEKDKNSGDLGSFVEYLTLDPQAECDPRLTTALLAEADPLGLDCGSGQGSAYDSTAGVINYFNYAIINHFHVSAIHLALVTEHNAMAEELLRGFVTRIERYRDPRKPEHGADEPDWGRDVALLLLNGATLGMPLTSDEARQVQQYLDGAVERYSQFPNWDLWDPAVPDGTYDFRSQFQPAKGPDATKHEDIAFLLEYCWSPFKNPAGVRFVDCDVVRDPARWGEPR